MSSPPIFILREAPPRAGARAAATEERPALLDDPADERALALAARAALGIEDGRPDALADVVVRAALHAATLGPHGARTVERDAIRVLLRPGGAVADAMLVEGLVLALARPLGATPREAVDPRIALLDATFAFPPAANDPAADAADHATPSELAAEDALTLKRHARLVADSGARVVFSAQPLPTVALAQLEADGALVVDRVAPEDLLALARSTGARVVTDLASIAPRDLGRAGLVEARTLGEDEYVLVTRCPNPRTVTILVRGASREAVDAVAQSLHAALEAVEAALSARAPAPPRAERAPGAALPGIALALRSLAATVVGRERLAIDAFADAMEVVPGALAEDPALDTVQVLVVLRDSRDARDSSEERRTLPRVLDTIARARPRPPAMAAQETVE